MNTRPHKSELLKLFPVFAGMPAAKAERMLAAPSVHTLKAGTALFSASNPCNGSQMLVSGTVREMIGRVLRNFEDCGLVAPGREQVRILDPKRLRAILDGPMASRRAQ